MKLAPCLLLVVGALPLLVYPPVLLANLMSLGGHRTGNESPGVSLVTYSFLLGSTAYPAVYVFSLLLVIARIRENRAKAALGYSIAPMFYFGLLVLLGMLWGSIGPSERPAKSSAAPKPRWCTSV